MNVWNLLAMCLWMIPVHAGIVSEWTYSNACNAAQKEDWKCAQDSFKKLLVEDSDRPDLLYDAGVAAYRLQEFEKAAEIRDNLEAVTKV